MLFFKGSGTTPAKAIIRAGRECVELLQNNPSLLIELVDLVNEGTHWEAHIRVMALEAVTGEEESQAPPTKDKKPKNPEHSISGDPNAWRPPGMEHDPSSLKHVEKKFDKASYAGYVPDVPVRDIVLLQEQGLSHDQIAAMRRLYMSRAIQRRSAPAPKVENNK